MGSQIKARSTVALVLLASVIYFGASAYVMAGQVVEPPVLPEGSFCTPAGTATSDGHVIDGQPSHQCHCQHMTHSKDCEGQVEEKSSCKQWCHKEHCHCPVVCDPNDDVQENR